MFVCFPLQKEYHLATLSWPCFPGYGDTRYNVPFRFYLASVPTAPERYENETTGWCV